jgi:hypothetical protein
MLQVLSHKLGSASINSVTVTTSCLKELNATWSSCTESQTNLRYYLQSGIRWTEWLQNMNHHTDMSALVERTYVLQLFAKYRPIQYRVDLYRTIGQCIRYRRAEWQFYRIDQCCQPLYARGTLNIVEPSWRHTSPILNIVGGGGETVYGIDCQRQLLINRPQPKNVLFDVHNYPSLLLCHLF